jgi:hypothetical protein
MIPHTTTFNRVDGRRPAPQPHPLVRRARRDADLALIEAHVRERGVTACPPMFCAASQHACDVAAPPVTAPPDTPIDTVADAARWLRINAMVDFERFADGRYLRAGRILSAEQLIAWVRRLRDTAAQRPRPPHPHAPVDAQERA